MLRFLDAKLDAVRAATSPFAVQHKSGGRQVLRRPELRRRGCFFDGERVSFGVGRSAQTRSDTRAYQCLTDLLILYAEILPYLDAIVPGPGKCANLVRGSGQTQNYLVIGSSLPHDAPNSTERVFNEF